MTGLEEAKQRAANFYFYLSLYMCFLAALGFIPGLFLPRPDPTVLQNPVVHLHALVYVGWLGLVAYQMRLPSQGRIADHRRIGQWLAYYAVFLVVMGLWVTFSRFGDRLEMGDPVAASIELWPPFSDMLVFPVLFSLAFAYRKQPEMHKRLMILACTMLLIPAAARMFFMGRPPNILLLEIVFLSPIYLAMIRDWVVERRVHPVYLVGIVVLALMPLRMVVVGWPIWQSFSGWLANFVT